MTVQQNAAHFFRKVEAAQDQELRQQVFQAPRRFIQLASNCGYKFSLDTLSEDIAALSTDQLARIFNPGLGIRRHLIRR